MGEVTDTLFRRREMGEREEKNESLTRFPDFAHSFC
jgi:hypothetical protein